MTSRIFSSLALVILCVLGTSCEGGESAAMVPDVLDLFPHAGSGTEKGEQGRIKLMAETKTHRIVFVGAGASLSFEELELPASFRFETELELLGAPTKSRDPLIAELAAVDERGRETIVEVVVRPNSERGRRWIPFAADVTAEAPVRELRVRFKREDFVRGSKGRLALLRPKVRFEREQKDLPARQPRQIVLITTDTLRADALGCYGNTEVKTPNMDRLASEGTLFERAFTAANVTNPSHTSMFTSLYLKDHGVLDNFTKLAPEVPTMLEPLREAGFRSAAFVSSFNFQPEKSDFDKRFDEFFPCEIYFERRAEDVNLDALPWLTEHANDDFFIWLHYFDVHMPYVPPYPFNRVAAENDAEADDEEIDLPIDYKGNLNWFAGTRKASHYRAMYRGEVNYLDDQLGELFDQMKVTGIYDRATIALVSDHGEALGEHGVYCDHASLYDEVTQVPFLVKLPGGSTPESARRVDALVSTVDLYPTLFELYGLALPSAVRGTSLVPWLHGEEGPDSTAAFSTFARGAQETMRTSTHRYLRGIKSEQLFPEYSIEAGQEELIELGAAGEWSDVTKSQAEVRQDLGVELTEFLSDELDYESVPIDEEFVEEMSGLGYTQGGDDE